jgi:hypothetical protein
MHVLSGTVHYLYLIKARFSNSLSPSLDHLFVIVGPAQLNSRSDAARAGSGQFNCIKTSFKFGQAAKLMVSVDCECRYCDSDVWVLLLVISRLPGSAGCIGK